MCVCGGEGGGGGRAQGTHSINQLVVERNERSREE